MARTKTEVRPVDRLDVLQDEVKEIHEEFSARLESVTAMIEAERKMRSLEARPHTNGNGHTNGHSNGASATAAPKTRKPKVAKPEVEESKAAPVSDELKRALRKQFKTTKDARSLKEFVAVLKEAGHEVTGAEVKAGLKALEQDGKVALKDKQWTPTS